MNPWTSGIRFPWPSTCQVCGRWPSAPVCHACRAQFAMPSARCQRCGSRLPQTNACAACQMHGSTALEQTVVAVDYAYPWDRIVARFKFQGECGWAGTLADLLLRAPGFDEMAAVCDWVIPIPLSRDKLADRGYNQAWELARALCRRHHALGQRGLPQGLLRQGGLADQHTLARRQRLSNLRHAFSVNPAMRDRLAGSNILLVDDVSTTGATLRCAAQALLREGARTVHAAVFARTP